MAKKQNRRVVLTVQPELDSILDDIATIKNQPKARVIVEILENAKPVLSAIAQMLKQADNAEKAYQHALKLSHTVNVETGNIHKQMINYLNQIEMDLERDKL